MRPRRIALMGWLAAAAALAAVFVAWRDPHLVRDLSDAVWSCFG